MLFYFDVFSQIINWSASKEASKRSPALWDEVKRAFWRAKTLVWKGGKPFGKVL